MAIYLANLMTGNPPSIWRGLYQGQVLEVEGVIKVKSGVKLTSGDVLKFFRIGENTSVRRFTLSTDGDLDDGTAALAGSLGYIQALNSAGTALTVDDKTGGTTYPSPATSAAYWAAAGASVLRAPGIIEYAPTADSGVVFANHDVDGFSGPVDVGISITTTANGDAAADVLIRLYAELVYKEAAQGEFSGALANAYTDRYSGGSSSGGLVS